MIRYIIGIISGAGLFVLGFLLLISAEAWYLENQLNVSPLPGTRQQEWILQFSEVAFYQLGTALLFTIIWHSVGYWWYRIHDWRQAGGMLVWSGLFIALLLWVAVIGWMYTDPTQDAGKLIAVAAYVVNAAFVYYGSSLFASPTNVQYVPPGSAKLGRIRG